MIPSPTALQQTLSDLIPTQVLITCKLPSIHINSVLLLLCCPPHLIHSFKLVCQPATPTTHFILSPWHLQNSHNPIAVVTLPRASPHHHQHCLPQSHLLLLHYQTCGILCSTFYFGPSIPSLPRNNSIAPADSQTTTTTTAHKAQVLLYRSVTCAWRCRYSPWSVSHVSERIPRRPRYRSSSRFHSYSRRLRTYKRGSSHRSRCYFGYPHVDGR